MSRRLRPLGYGRSLFDYDDYDDYNDYDLFTPAALVVTPMVVTPVVPIWFTFSPALYGVMSWMTPDLLEIWQEWQDNIRGEKYTLEQRKRLLLKALNRANETHIWGPWPPSDIQLTAERILAMERELGADQYGHVNTAAANPPGQSAITASSSSSTTTTTTTTVTQQQRDLAANLYLQSLQTWGSPAEQAASRQKAERTASMMRNGEADQVVQHHLDHAPRGGAAQSNIPSSTTIVAQTTTVLTQDQRNEAGQLYLQSLNNNGVTIDPAEAQRTYQQIIGGQSEQLAQHFLQTKQSNAAQRNVVQQLPPPQQPLQIEAPPVQQQRSQRQRIREQRSHHQQSQPQQIQASQPQQQQQQQQQQQPLQVQGHMSTTQQYAQQQHAQQQPAFQQVPAHQPMQSPVQYVPPQASAHAQPQSPSQQFHSTTMTTITTSTNSSNVYGQQIPQVYQQLVQSPQPMQQTQYQTQQQIAPGTPGQFTQQPQTTWPNQGNQPSPQQAGHQQQGYFPQAPQSQRPAINSRPSSSKEPRKAEREARKASRNARK